MSKKKVSRKADHRSPILNLIFKIYLTFKYRELLLIYEEKCILGGKVKNEKRYTFSFFIVSILFENFQQLKSRETKV
jgi:hypothetical protein